MVPLTQKVIFLLIPDFAVLGHIYTLIIFKIQTYGLCRLNT